MPAALAIVAVVAVILAIATVLARRNLARTRAELESAKASLAELEQARAGHEAERDQLQQSLDEERARAEAAATEAAGAAESLAEVERDRAAAAAGRDEAEAALSEAAIAVARLVDDGAGDVAALWVLEQQRSERLWKGSVAAVADDPSPFAAARHPLWTALEVEVAAIREEVGAVVDLDIDLPEQVPAGAALATLRAAQELLAATAAAGEETLLHVGAEGTDIVIRVEATDAEGNQLTLPPLDLPPSRLEVEPGLIRLRNVLAAAAS